MWVCSGVHTKVFATVTLRIENVTCLEKVALLINGREIIDFMGKLVTVKVFPGDVMAVDGSFYDHEIIFSVFSTSENILEPQKNQLFRVNGDIVTIGKIKLI